MEKKTNTNVSEEFKSIAERADRINAILEESGSELTVEFATIWKNNVEKAAYAINGSESVREAFGDDWEAYYLFYMLNYDNEQSVNTVSANDESKLQKQYNHISFNISIYFASNLL